MGSAGERLVGELLDIIHAEKLRWDREYRALAPELIAFSILGNVQALHDALCRQRSLWFGLPSRVERCLLTAVQSLPQQLHFRAGEFVRAQVEYLAQHQMNQKTRLFAEQHLLMIKAAGSPPELFTSEVALLRSKLPLSAS